mmetsp:Transcript_50608/g.127107  ORF Transcript_50608/g.127107 Transcript_50608/m.127107 type:complete len:240 (-) Transcript_50608:643-1362(-)
MACFSSRFAERRSPLESDRRARHRCARRRTSSASRPHCCSVQWTLLRAAPSGPASRGETMPPLRSAVWRADSAAPESLLPECERRRWPPLLVVERVCCDWCTAEPSKAVAALCASSRRVTASATRASAERISFSPDSHCSSASTKSTAQRAWHCASSQRRCSSRKRRVGWHSSPLAWSESSTSSPALLPEPVSLSPLCCVARFSSRVASAARSTVCASGARPPRIRSTASLLAWHSWSR